jgi:RNA polymerase sigma-70 factor (ECF subfamily)
VTDRAAEGPGGRGAPDYRDDDVLVAALRRRDDDAFAWLLDRYSGSLRRVARAHVATASAADEVVQETWVAVINGIGRFEQRSSVKTWIHRIVLNIARTKGVREHRSVPFSSLAAEAEHDEPVVDPERFVAPGRPHAGAWAAPPVAWDEEPETRLSAGETLTVVQEAIDALPDGQQVVITLRDLEGWAPDEVCNALELSETNQRVLLHRARAKVRRALERHFEESNR